MLASNIRIDFSNEKQNVRHWFVQSILDVTTNAAPVVDPRHKLKYIQKNRDAPGERKCINRASLHSNTPPYYGVIDTHSLEPYLELITPINLPGLNTQIKPVTAHVPPQKRQQG